MYSQPEFGQEATEEPMGEGLMDPEGQTYDETQQVRTSALTLVHKFTRRKSNMFTSQISNHFQIVFYMLQCSFMNPG